MTNTVTLRDVTEADLPIFYEQQLVPEALLMAAFPSREREAFMVHWRKNMANTSNDMQTILYGEQVAGNIVCYGPLDEREIGYWLGKDFWGNGIATQALTLYLQRIPTRPLYAHVAQHNIGSRRVLEKCGFVISGEDRIFSETHGAIVEEHILKLT